MKKRTILLSTVRLAVLAVFCFVLWLILSNELNIWSASAGILFSVAASFYAYKIFYEEGEYSRSDFIIRFEFFLLYLFLFVIQSYVAGFELIYRMITGKYRPATIRIRTRLNSKMGRVFLANTITMIPGTLSLWLDNKHIYVHWFDAKTSHTVNAGHLIKQDFEKILERIFE